MKKLSLLILVVTMAFFSAPAHANLITNGGFENGLVGWTTSGDVTLTDDGQATLGKDATVGKSTLSQKFYINQDAKALEVSFDLTFSVKEQNIVKGIVKDWLSVDLLTLTTTGSFLYFEWEDWTSSNIYEWDARKDGYFTTVKFKGFAQLENYIDKDPNAEIKFTLSEDWVGLFDVFHYTFIGIDNVFVGYANAGKARDDAPVPEPATLFLLGAGLIGMVAVSRKKRFKK